MTKRVPPRVKGKIHKMVVQPAMLYGMATVPMTDKQSGRLEVAEMKMRRWSCGWTRRDQKRNEEVRGRLEEESVTSRCRRARLRMVWSREKKGRNLCWEKNNGAGSARKERKRKA